MSQIKLSVELHSRLIAELREFLHKEWDVEVSEFKASMLLDFFLVKLAPDVYNQAVEDAHSLMTTRIEDILALAKRPR